MITVILNPYVLGRVKKYAKERSETARSRGIKDLKKGSQSGYLTDMYGLLGELAFSRLTGIPMATELLEVDEYDFILPDGQTVDVKHSKHRHATLMLGPKVEKDRTRLADIYVLTVGEPPDIDVVGYAEGDVLYENFKEHPRLGAYKRFMWQRELTPIEVLMKELEFLAT
jgi:hypothetical protein